LVFISFQGFSQTKTVKIKEIGLEVMKTDLGKMEWDEAKKAFENLGGGWRLPTIEELEKIYKYKDKIGNFALKSKYWSSTESGANGAWYVGFLKGNVFDAAKFNTYYVRAVRTLK
jgi:hypothetical protein